MICKKNLRSHKDRVPAGFLPIARDPGGNLICLALEGENANKVFFWDHENEYEEGEEVGYKNTNLIASSFEEFLASLH